MHPDRRAAVLAQVARADAGDMDEVYRRFVLHEMPSEVRLGFQLAFLVPFAVPEMAQVLLEGRTSGDPTRRAYHTGIVIHELVVHGPDSEAGRRLVAHMNRSHRDPRITDEQLRFVLDALIVVPVRWARRAGWRPVLEVERESSWSFYHRMGELMGIPALPASYAEASDSFDAAAQALVRPSQAGTRLGRLVTGVIASRFPAPVRPLVPAILGAVVQPATCARALGLPSAGRALGPALDLALGVRAARVARTAPPVGPSFTPGQRAGDVYPDGYDLDDVVGPQDGQDTRPGPATEGENRV